MADVLTKVHSFDSKIRQARAILRQIQLARKMFNSCIKTWEDGIKSHSLISPVTGISSAVNLHDDVEDRMNQYVTFTDDINTALNDLEFELPNKIKPGEPFWFISLNITAATGAIAATLNITEDSGTGNRPLKGPFYGLAIGDVVRLTTAEDSENNVYGTIASIQDDSSPTVEATGITIGAISGGVNNTADTRMTITRIQDFTA